MNLYSLHAWSKSVGGRCRFIDPLEPPPQIEIVEGEDRVLLTRLRREIISAHNAIEGSRLSITESWSLMSRCGLEFGRHD